MGGKGSGRPKKAPLPPPQSNTLSSWRGRREQSVSVVHRSSSVTELVPISDDDDTPNESPPAKICRAEVIPAFAVPPKMTPTVSMRVPLDESIVSAVGAVSVARYKNTLSIVQDATLMRNDMDALAPAVPFKAPRHITHVTQTIVHGGMHFHTTSNQYTTNLVNVEATLGRRPPAPLGVNIKTAPCPPPNHTSAAQTDAATGWTVTLATAPAEIAKTFGDAVHKAAVRATKQSLDEQSSKPNSAEEQVPKTKSKAKTERKSYSVIEKLAYIKHKKIPDGGIQVRSAEKWAESLREFEQWVSAGRGDSKKMKAPQKHLELFMHIHSKYLTCRDHGEQISTQRIAQWMRDYDLSDFKKLTHARQRAIVLYYMALYRLTVRVITGEPQVCPSDSATRVLQFKRMFFSACKKKGYRVFLFGDETFVLRKPVRNTTIAPIGTKHPTAKNAGDKAGATVWLCAGMIVKKSNNPTQKDLDLTMLKPYVLFDHSVKDKETLAIAKHRPHNDSAGCLVSRTDSGWMNAPAMIRWIKDGGLPTCTRLNPGLMIWDLHASHRAPEVIDALKEKHYDVMFIPGGVTGELQIMDTHVNRSFKSMVRTLYEISMDDQTQLFNNAASGESDEDDALVIQKQNDDDNANTLGTTQTVKALPKKSYQNAKTQCLRVKQAWEKQSLNCIKGFLHHLLPLLQDEVRPADPEADKEEKRLFELSNIRMDAEDRVVESYLATTTVEVLSKCVNDHDSDVDELEAKMDSLMMTHMTMGDVEDDEKGEGIERLLTVLSALDDNCPYCETKIAENDLTTMCKYCSVSFHPMCVTTSSATDFKGRQKALDNTLCKTCNVLAHKHKSICVYCHDGDEGSQSLDRCGAGRCPLRLHLKCAIKFCKEKELTITNVNKCPFHHQ